jgi:hypothetical protein
MEPAPSQRHRAALAFGITVSNAEGDRMARPWLKFFPADWRADPALRMCSIGARGLWIEMLCIMHEATPYGSLLVNGAPVAARQLASLAGLSLRETHTYIAELRAAGVFSEEAGAIFSRRMRRDEARAQLDRANGRAGGNPALKRGVNPLLGEPDKAQTPEPRGQYPDQDQGAGAAAPRPARETGDAAQASSASKRDQPVGATHEAFETFKAHYPRRKGANPWRPARAQWDAALRAGACPDRIIAALKAGIGFDREKIGTEFIPQAVKWLRDRRFEDHATASTPAGEAARVAHYAAADSPELAAWDAHARATTGRNLPRDRNGGWYVATRWPPGHAMAANPSDENSMTAERNLAERNS